MLDNNKRAWDSKLKLALWVVRITVKKATRKSPFELVYGTQVRLPMHNLLLVYKFIMQENGEVLEPIKERMEQLIELDEIKDQEQQQNKRL